MENFIDKIEQKVLHTKEYGGEIEIHHRLLSAVFKTNIVIVTSDMNQNKKILYI